MTVKAILDEKGRDIVSIAPTATLAEAAALLAEKRIGALVVSEGAGKIAGILSERDIVRAVGTRGSQALDEKVAASMTSKVSTCRDSFTVNQVMEVMTRNRFRHLPVERDGRIDGIISIGDVVKWRIWEVEQEAEQIRTYIATA